ncbi:hypothetical protein O181_066165 [Austropuccinia psidii MF-1]|uniref:Uncharacterized protein n=1 Tax=Austropuccinia psidii MF-1 TaxID=1389203 RepID=A0A9Q3I4U6_9BASI|nr:hypothetical protein [Austropuccinia psidii MF-1]
MLRWQIDIQEYHMTNADGLRIWPLDNVTSNPAYDPEVAARIPFHFMEIDRKKNFRLSEWAPEGCTPDSGNTCSEGTETPILGIGSSKLHIQFFNSVIETYAKDKSVAYCYNSFSKCTQAQNWNPSWRNPG